MEQKVENFTDKELSVNISLIFYYLKVKLVIELESSQHYEKETVKYDTFRTEYLNRLGLYVLRFSNRDIDDYFESVCQNIE